MAVEQHSNEATVTIDAMLEAERNQIYMRRKRHIASKKAEGRNIIR